MNPMPNRIKVPEKSRRGISGVLKEIFTYSKNMKVPTTIAMLLAVAGAILTIIGPNQLSKITDLISDSLYGEIDLDAITKTGIVLLCIYGFGALFTFLQHYIMATVTLVLSKKMRGDLSQKINRVPMKIGRAHV